MVFNEITQKAIQAAFEAPGESILRGAQQARRLWIALSALGGHFYGPRWRGLSAGRVQSVAVRLIVEREREIRAVPEEYWEVHALLKAGDIDPVRFMVTHRGGASSSPRLRPMLKRCRGHARGCVFGH